MLSGGVARACGTAATTAVVPEPLPVTAAMRIYLRVPFGTPSMTAVVEVERVFGVRIVHDELFSDVSIE
jgi:hypothetical protein